MWLPSMPPPPEPSTRLSRVPAQEACFKTSTSGMPYLAKMPRSLAMISGEASVRAMKPRRALAVSGPGRAAKAPEGRRAWAAAIVAAPAVSARRRVRVLRSWDRSQLVLEGDPDLGPGGGWRGRAGGHAVVAF